jgi:hypothetical protein
MGIDFSCGEPNNGVVPTRCPPILAEQGLFNMDYTPAARRIILKRWAKAMNKSGRRIQMRTVLLFAMMVVLCTAGCSKSKSQIFTCATCGVPVTNVGVDSFGNIFGTCPKGHHTTVTAK